MNASFTIEQLFSRCFLLSSRTPSLQNKIARAQLIILNDGVSHAGGLDYFVAASDGKGSYIVTVGSRLDCGCADFTNHQGKVKCKHIIAAELYRDLTSSNDNYSRLAAIPFDPR